MLNRSNKDNTFKQFMNYHQGRDNMLTCKEKKLKLFYITNCPKVALIAEKYDVDRIWIDLEVLGKEIRQKGLNTVKSHHTISDIEIIKPLLTRSEMLVRVNSWHDGSKSEIEEVIDAGADIIMLPYWKTVGEIKEFITAVNGRCKTSLLLETKEAVECIDDVLKYGGFDEIHIGLNDLHLSYGKKFMFELLADGTVERLCEKFKRKGLPYGFGGIARIGDGLLPAEKIIMEHYRLGSSRAILARTFCESAKFDNVEEFERVFKENMRRLREFESYIINATNNDFESNRIDVIKSVSEIVSSV